jgi:protein-L-isoaspartate(D-aspartate) O-methyltransferase
MTMEASRASALIVLLVAWIMNPALAAEPDYAAKRRALVELISDDVRSTHRFLGKGVLDPRVMAALGNVPRHEFVADQQKIYAYENRPLPIGYGQTISQPYIVAIMTDLLALQPQHRVLEIGTGSGYQAAILAALVKEVYTIEIIDGLARDAAATLQRLHIGGVHTRTGDGYYGWPEGAPFDAIIVTAAASHVPPPLVQQLKPGGRMVIPVGSRFLTQQLALLEKQQDGRVTIQQVLPVMFVPLTGGH